MASMSRTSTLMNLQELATTADAKPAENPIGFLPLEILPNEVYSLVSTTNYTMTPETTETKTSNLSELSWLFEILTSNITMITVSSIMAALLYHTLYSVSSSVQDFCFSSSPINTSPVPSPFAEETCSINSTDELMQWAELITPAVQPLLSKIYNFLIFPVAPIALSVVLAWNTPGSRRPSRLAEMFVY